MCSLSVTFPPPRSSWKKTLHPNRRGGSTTRAAGRLTPRVGPGRSLSRKGRACGAADAVSARAESGQSARAQAGAQRQRRAAAREAAEKVETSDGLRLLLRPFYLVVSALGLKTSQKK